MAFRQWWWESCPDYDRAMAQTPELPEQPQLRSAAIALEELEMIGQVFDHKWRSVHISSALTTLVGASESDVSWLLGKSAVIQILTHRLVAWPRESQLRSWDLMGRMMRHDVPPEDPDFEEVFGPMTKAARELEPLDPEPVTTFERNLMPDDAARWAWHGTVRDLYLRLVTDDGVHVGTMLVVRPPMGDPLLTRLALGHAPMYERMLELREPMRRPAAILFADLEASGDLSRRLSSAAYFVLIRSLTDLVDSEVASRGGLIGKHAGDGASALFVAGDGSPESDLARGAIEAARAIREGARDLLDGEPEVLVNIGLHWGATLTVGQVSSHGRLEVTALGDEMNEAARIESVARGGAALASKDLIERLSPEDADALDLNPASIRFTQISSMGADDKAIRDAGTIAVAEI